MRTVLLTVALGALAAVGASVSTGVLRGGPVVVSESAPCQPYWSDSEHPETPPHALTASCGYSNEEGAR